MKLSPKRLFEATSLCPLAFVSTGCITRGSVFNTVSRPHVEQWWSDAIKGSSPTEDSNGTESYIFVGESLDYLLTIGGNEVVKVLSNPIVHDERITVPDDAKFVLNSSNKNLFGAIALYYDWNSGENKALVV